MDNVVYIIAPALLIAVVLAAVWLERFSVPVIIVALGAGILFGSDVLKIWHFDDVVLTNQIANLALVFILFHGGFATKRSDFRAVALPASGLATWGVVLTALTTFAVLHLVLGWAYELSLLLAVIISSTDAAAIFSILRQQSLPSKLSSTVEVESAANDPMAILMTLIGVTAVASGQPFGWDTALSFIWQFTAGPLIGYALARAALGLFNWVKPQERGYYYVLFLGVVLLIAGLAQLIQASAMLAVFTAGFVMGNRPFIHKHALRNFSMAISTIANIGMFVMMGLLVFPSTWGGLWIEGTILFLVITFISRPVAVLLGTVGMKIPFKRKTFIAWAGLRGAVPIILATYPLAEGLPQGEHVFNLVFFAVILSILLQGSSLPVVAKWLDLAVPARPQPLFELDLVTMAKTDYDLIVVDLPDPEGVEGPRIRDLELPEGSVITLISRGPEVILPKGNTRLRGWDHVTVLAHAPDSDAVRTALVDAFRPYEGAQAAKTETTQTDERAKGDEKGEPP